MAITKKDLDVMARKLENALAKETPESLKKWLLEQRAKEAEVIKEKYRKSREIMKNLTKFER